MYFDAEIEWFDGEITKRPFTPESWKNFYADFQNDEIYDVRFSNWRF